MDGCFPTAVKVDNQSLATLRISCSVIVTLPFRKNPVHSPLGSCLSMGMLERVCGGGIPCPSSHQRLILWLSRFLSCGVFLGSITLCLFALLFLTNCLKIQDGFLRINYTILRLTYVPTVSLCEPKSDLGFI